MCVLQLIPEALHLPRERGILLYRLRGYRQRSGIGAIVRVGSTPFAVPPGKPPRTSLSSPSSLWTSAWDRARASSAAFLSSWDCESDRRSSALSRRAEAATSAALPPVDGVPLADPLLVDGPADPGVVEPPASRDALTNAGQGHSAPGSGEDPKVAVVVVPEDRLERAE